MAFVKVLGDLPFFCTGFSLAIAKSVQMEEWYELVNVFHYLTFLLVAKAIRYGRISMSMRVGTNGAQ